MPVELFANQPSTTVSSGGTDAPASGTQETWTVASSSLFPAAASGTAPATQFHVADASASASSELITVKNVSGTTWTVLRGAESTTPVAHASGFTIYQVVTAGVITTFPQSGTGIYWVVPSGDVTGAADPVRVNAATSAAAAAGGVVQGMPAAPFYLDTPFIVHSGVTLDMTGCTVNEVAESNCNMITNPAATTSAATGTGSMTSGANVLTTTLASVAVAGQSVYVAGGANSGANVLCGLAGVINTGAGTITLVDFTGAALNAQANVTSGVVTLYNRDSAIEIRGGTWNRGANGFNGAGPGPGFSPLACTTNLKRIDGLNVHDMTLTCTVKGYNLHYGDCSNFRFRNITIGAPTNVVNTDGCNGHGPLAFGTVENFFGTNGDDMAALACLDSGLTEDTTGDVQQVEVSNFFPNGNAGADITLFNDGNYKMSKITCHGMHGSSTSPTVHIWAGTSDNYMDDILCEDISGNSLAGLVSIFATNADGQITCRDLAWSGGADATGAVVQVASGSSLGALTVDGVFMQTASAYGVEIAGTVGIVEIRNIRQADGTIDTGAPVFVASSGTVDALSVKGAHLFMGSGDSNTVVYLAGPVNTVHYDDCYVNGSGGILFGTASGLAQTQVLMSNTTLDGANYLANLDSAVDFTITNLNVKSIAAGSLIWLGNSGATVTLRGRGLINPNAVTTFGNLSGSGAAAPRVIHPEALVDLSTISRAGNGDTAYNTNSGLACGVGVAISNGSNTTNSWKNLFSGSTY